jgi:hypothetical protein
MSTRFSCVSSELKSGRNQEIYDDMPAVVHGDRESTANRNVYGTNNVHLRYFVLRQPRCREIRYCVGRERHRRGIVAYGKARALHSETDDDISDGMIAAGAPRRQLSLWLALWVSMTYYGTSNIIPVHSLCLESWKIHNYGNSTSL